MSIKSKIFVTFLAYVGFVDMCFGQSATTILNRASSQDLCFQVNIAGSPTTVECIRGATGVAAFTRTGSATNPNIQIGPNASVGFWSPSTNVVALGHAASEKFRLHSNGFIGINDASPSDQLTVNGGIKGGRFYSLTQSTSTSANTNLDLASLVVAAGASYLLTVVANRSGGSTTETWIINKAVQSATGSCATGLLGGETNTLDLIGGIVCTNNGADTIIRLPSTNAAGSSTTYDVMMTRLQ